MRVVGHWLRVPKKAKQWATLKVLKIQADTALSNLLWLTCNLLRYLPTSASPS